MHDTRNNYAPTPKEAILAPMFFLKRFGHKPPPYANFGGGLFLNGLLFVLFGLAVLAAPELLAYLVAIILIVFGASLLTAWWKLKESSKNWPRG